MLSTEDGRRQLGVMINELLAPTAVLEVFTRTWMAIATQLLQAAPTGATGASLAVATPAATPTPTLDQVRADLAARTPQH